jgi:UDP-glucuronate 4-epimerase
LEFGYKLKILATGCAGFIGMHTSKRLLERGDEVVGIDNLNNYYDVELKKARLNQLLQYPNFRFHEVDIANREQLAEVLGILYSEGFLSNWMGHLLPVH